MEIKSSIRINLDDESVLETKYFVSKDDDDQAGATISIDFDESEQMTFLALKVKPNEQEWAIKVFEFIPARKI